MPLPPVATSTAPSGSMATSYGASSRGAHSSSHNPSGCTRIDGAGRGCGDPATTTPAGRTAAVTGMSTTAIEVISVETLGIDGVTGGGAGGASVICRRRPGRGRFAPRRRSRPSDRRESRESPGRSCRAAGNPCRRVDAEHATGRAGADQQAADSIEGQRDGVRGLGREELLALAVRRDLVDGALVAGAGEDVALRDRRRATRCICRRDRRTARPGPWHRRCRCGRRATCRHTARPFGAGASACTSISALS